MTLVAETCGRKEQVIQADPDPAGGNAGCREEAGDGLPDGSMKRNMRKLILVLLAVLFLGSTAVLGYRLYQYREAEEIYKEAEGLVTIPELPKQATPVEPPAEPEKEPEPEIPPEAVTDEKAPEEDVPKEEETLSAELYEKALWKMDFRALREVNSDVLGWIHIPYTQLSYPVVQGEDNEFYLDHTWKKTYSSVGSIFMEQYCSRDLSDFNTILYGHRMQDGSMFASLRFYNDHSYWKKYPWVYVWDENGGYIYEIFSAYEAGLTDPTYMLGMTGDEEKQTFLDFCISKSVIDTGITPTINDRILTLSTCTGRGHATRWVVQAVRRMPTDTAQP